MKTQTLKEELQRNRLITLLCTVFIAIFLTIGYFNISSKLDKISIQQTELLQSNN